MWGQGRVNLWYSLLKRDPLIKMKFSLKEYQSKEGSGVISIGMDFFVKQQFHAEFLALSAKKINIGKSEKHNL